MKGIISYGTYVPYNRLQRIKIKEFLGNPVFAGEKAVASYDEDSVSMGVGAASYCLKDFDGSKISSVIFATTSGPYKEKSSVPTIVKALDLNTDVHALENAHSMRGATSAIMASVTDQTLIISADSRLGAPNGTDEQLFGDGAAAFLLGSGENVIARIVDKASSQHDVIGQWRSQSDPFTQNWEERFQLDAFMRSVIGTVQAFMAKNNLTADAVTKVIIAGPDGKAYLQGAKKLGFKEGQIQDPLLNTIGATGTAHAPMMLVAALENAKPGDRLLVVNYAEGTDVLLLEVTDAILKLPRRKGIQEQVDTKNADLSYSDYLKWRGILSVEPPRRPETPRPSAPAMYRNYDQNLGFYGSKCRVCGTPQFPKQRVCARCYTKDEMDNYRFVGKDATVTTFTVDYLAASPAPPNLIAVIDFKGGGRIICEVTDCHKDDIEIGMEVEMTFRRIYESKGIHNYFWKAQPKLRKGDKIK